MTDLTIMKYIAVLFLVPLVYAYYKPKVGDTFQWQLEVDDDTPFDYSMDASLYDVDLWGVSSHAISAIHAKGKHVICYFSAGTFDPERDDAGDFHDNVKGNSLADWPKERWIDIRSDNVKGIMSKRMDLAKSKHCDGIEPDNVDGHEDGNDEHFHFSYHDQLVYNRWLADEAHSRGMSIGLKNDAEQIPELHGKFDWALNEECHSNDGGRECDLYKTFLNAGKPVFNIEYVNHESVSQHDLSKCHSHHPSGMSTQFKLWDVTAWTHRC